MRTHPEAIGIKYVAFLTNVLVLSYVTLSQGRRIREDDDKILDGLGSDNGTSIFVL